MQREWGDECIIVHAEVFTPHLLPGYKAVEADQVIGLITYQISGDHCEIVTLNAFRQGVGVGKALLIQVEETARLAGCSACRLVTTNDNLNALGFYQKNGYRIIEIHAGAVEEARRLKPSIPLVAENGIPIRDEITLENVLALGGNSTLK